MGCKRGDSTANDLNSDLMKISDSTFHWRMRFNPDLKNKNKRLFLVEKLYFDENFLD